jgi:hypothetical protein
MACLRASGLAYLGAATAGGKAGAAVGSVADEEEPPGAVRREADPVGDVGAVALHVLVVAGEDQLEQLDELRRGQRLDRIAGEVRQIYISSGVPTSTWT